MVKPIVAHLEKFGITVYSYPLEEYLVVITEKRSGKLRIKITQPDNKQTLEEMLDYLKEGLDTGVGSTAEKRKLPYLLVSIDPYTKQIKVYAEENGLTIDQLPEILKKIPNLYRFGIQDLPENFNQYKVRKIEV